SAPWRLAQKREEAPPAGGALIQWTLAERPQALTVGTPSRFTPRRFRKGDGGTVVVPRGFAASGVCVIPDCGAAAASGCAGNARGSTAGSAATFGTAPAIPTEAAAAGAGLSALAFTAFLLD